MPTKAELYAQMADKVATQLTGSWQEWAGFLTTASRLYKYPFHEQLMIYAQRPDATACAEYDLWNEKMGRYVRRGSKGIALVDDSGDRPRLRYVFDISDTGTREHSRTPWLWQLEERHLDSVQAMLERAYDVSGDDLAGQLTEVAGKLAEEYWTEHQQDFFYIVDGSFLEEYDEYNIGVQFKAAATVSITYALMSRCGLEPERYFDHEDFMAIFDFNTPSTIGALGTAVSQLGQQVLRQIGVTVRNAEREANQERSKQDEQSHDLYPERRLSDSRPEAEPAAGETPGQVRKDEENLPEGTPSHPLQPDVAEREAVPAPSGDRRDRPEQTGADDAPAGEGSGSHRGTESQRSHEVGGADEHLQSSGRGNPDGGAYQQLTLNLFLSEAEQIQSIDEAENVAHTSSAFSFAQNDIDHVLRLGGNTDRQRERVVAAFEKQKTTAEIAEILKTLYHGGNGLGSVSAWYAEDGIHLSHGKSARYDRSAQVISWESAAERIGELLESGQFASNVELAEAADYERSLLVEKLWYLYHDLSEGAREAGYLSCLSEIKGNGFPEETRRLMEQLSEPAFRQTLKEEYAAFRTAYQQDRDLLRFHYHRPREIWENLKDLDLPRRTFSSDLSQVPTVQHFITEDEIDAAMTGGSSFAGGKGRIYAFFMENHTDKEKVRFLKDEYGIGGRSHALSGATHSGEDHDGKGLHYKKQDCPDVHLNWENVAKRITSLVQKGRYLTEQEQAQYDKIQAEKEQAEEDAIQAQQPDSAVWEYNGVKERHPDDMVLYQMGDFFELYGEDAKEAAAELNINLTTRAIPSGGRVEMCGFPANQLEQMVEQLRDKHDVTISAVPEGGKERQEYSMPSIDHEAEQHINAQEAEFGADGNRVFWDTEATAAPTLREQFEQYKPVVTAAISEDAAYRNACGHSDRENAVIEGNAAVRRAVLSSKDMELIRLYSDIPEFRQRLHREVIDETYPKLHELLRPLSQEDIDTALCTWNGNIESKQAVVRYMKDHAREKDTASWLAQEYGGSNSNSLFITRAGSPEETQLPWPKVQRRIAQLIQEDRFYTEEEQDRFDNIDPIAIREALEERGIVNGQVADPEKLDNDPFIQQVMSDVEQIAAAETEQTSEVSISDEEYDAVRRPTPQRTSYDPAAPVYAVGDTVYIEDDAYQITELRDDTVQLLPTGMVYPIYRAERKEQFEQLLRADRRNAYYTEFLPVDPDKADQDLRDVLAHGLMDEADKQQISTLLQSGRSNSEIAYWLSRAYFGEIETLNLETGDIADYRTTAQGIELEVMDAEEKRLAMLYFRWDEVAPLLRGMYARQQDGLGQEQPQPATESPTFHSETMAVYPGDKNNLPYDVVVERLHIEEPEPPAPVTEPEKTFEEVLDEHPVSIQVNGQWQTFPNAKAAEETSYEEYKANLRRNAKNFRITDEHLGEGGPKAKFQANVNAIRLLKELEAAGQQASPEQQEILSQYVGWGGLSDAFDPEKPAWALEYAQLKELLTPEEYAAGRSSTLNAHYTSPTVIKAIYDAVDRMGFETGNILEPSMGVGNFFGMLPEEMRNSRLYGVELDPVSGRIAKQLYPKADITVGGFETTDRRDFFDLAIGNVPFGQYQVNDKAYNKLNFNIHNYFFAKALDQVRPGGVVAFVTSRYTMDAKDSTVRRYLAQRAELLGAIRLPNDAFKKNAGAEVVSDIIFLQKRDRPLDIVPEWTQTRQTEDGFAINRYFIDHPEMVLGRQEPVSTAHGMDYTVNPIEGLELSDQLHDAVKYIHGTYQEAELPELGEGEAIDTSIPADPNVKNYSYAIVDGQVYYRENSRMVRPDLNATAEARVKGLVGLRDCVQELIDLQMDAAVPDSTITQKQAELNSLYDSFSAKYGLINDRANRLAYADDSSYYLLCALEVIDEDGKLERKADMFTKRTIKPHQAVAVVDTASEALAVSISEKACVDMSYMSQLTGKTKEELAGELQGVIFRVPGQLEKDGTPHYVTADEYLSGNVRRKLRQAQRAAQQDPVYAVNVEALTAAQPKDLDASEIEVRLGATWIDKEYIQQFMYETFNTPFYLQRSIEVNYSSFTAEWQIKGKSSVSYNDVAAYTTYGTSRANAYKILEDSLNLRDVRIYDTIEDADGKERRVLNAKETTLAAQKQQAIREAFRDWIWKDPERRQTLVRQYNEEMNSTRPREYDGSHITFGGMNPAITLREHQKSAIAHVLYGGNTLLAHEVGAGKTFEMVAAAMEAKRLGLCQKSLFVVPNHLTEQWASEFLRLYPSANILVTTKKDFETHNRKKFCARIATGEYDAIIMGHSQFERIPISRERQERLLYEQIDEITEGIAEVQASGGERFTVKQLERTRKSLEARLEKLQAEGRKDDVVTFEQLGVDRLFVDEAHNYKNLFLYTKMRNVAGLSTSDAQKSSDMFAKCRYMDEITGNRGVIFATGTPVSNSMTELYTMQRYLQYERLQELNMTHFDCWASRFGETVTALELAPEGTGYRARTRFSKFFNLPELMNLFKEVADIKTADQLNLPTPEVEYHNIVAQPTEHQQEMVKALSERASLVHSGTVDPSQDNMLKITSDGRKLGLDQRIVNQMLPDEPGTKVNQCVDNIMQIWRDGEVDKLTQLVFCDISTPQAKAPASKAAKTLDNPLLHALEGAVPLPEQEPAFTVYDDIRQKLIAQGMPADQIAFIHEANTEVRKKELFSKVRTGQVRVLMGSTAKMGAGTNVQDRLVALHDLDCPWRPGDLAQRKGRIERQGNSNPLVHVYRYVTEGTFDAYLWQTVENKQKFISQIMTSKSPVRSCDDVDETALSFAEIKALCAGDPRIKERMDLDVEVSRLKLMKADHQSKQYRLEDQLLKYFPEEIEKHKGFIKGFESDMEVLAAHPHPEDGFAGMEIRGDLLTDKENAGAALLDACKEVKTSDPVQIGSYRGYAMSVEFSAWKQEYTLLLKGQMTHRATLGTDPRGNLTRIDNALAQMPQRLEAAKAQLDNLYQQQAAAKEEVGKPFIYEEELKSKNARLVELDTLLNIDGKGQGQAHTESAVAKSTRPSVLDHLKRPVPPHSTDKKPKQHEEVR
ncbi:helicase SNF2 [Clostridioides difficile]|nr:helicase SNF2 [Clostridioides difficile]EGT5002148.1 helicase SNF2 [Clostridioides difficile]MBY1711891.1 DEAD/DEAH box helicase family protein [Clostridioides difficile]MCO8684929.1 DEAD/DEAH box helicase family protein [Clostridioides difficile]NJA35942.1 DEAD/DEAH box helicase family protein [Clostridioides difficile]